MSYLKILALFQISEFLHGFVDPYLTIRLYVCLILYGYCLSRHAGL